MKNKLLMILAGIILILSGLIYLQHNKVQRLNGQLHYQQYKDSTTISYTLTNKDTIKTVYVPYVKDTYKAKYDSLVKEFKLKTKDVTVVQQVATTGNISKAIGNIDTLNSTDTTKTYTYKDPYLAYTASVSPKQLHFSHFKLRDTLNIVTYKEGPYLKTGVTTTNPYITIDKVNATSYQLPKQNRFSLGLQAGVGFNGKGFGPTIGIGLNYRIL